MGEAGPQGPQAKAGVGKEKVSWAGPAPKVWQLRLVAPHSALNGKEKPPLQERKLVRKTYPGIKVQVTTREPIDA